MFRNSYDNDSVTYSPTGRLFQVEYALEAIKQGSAAVGLVSRTHAVVVALKRHAEELGSYQKKVIRIDDHMGVALAGLAPDARVLANHLRTLCIKARLLYDRPLAVARAVSSIADKAQTSTQEYGRRPYGVGLLVIGYDETGAHLFEFLPSGSMLEYLGSAIGARSQAARTYLERSVESLPEASLEELIMHGLTALRETLSQDKELTLKNTSIAFVGKDRPFTALDDDAVAPWLERLANEGGGTGRTQTSQSADAVPAEHTEENAAEPSASGSDDHGPTGPETESTEPTDRMDES